MQLKSCNGRAITPVSTLDFPDTSSQGSSPDHHYAKRMLDIKQTAFDESEVSDRWQHAQHGYGLLSFMLESAERQLQGGDAADPVDSPPYVLKTVKFLANGVNGLGAFAKESTIQATFLRHINHNIEDKDQMLAFLGQYQWMLDPVNRVTCVYRLAKMFTSHHVRCDPRWKADLATNEGFQRLLRGLASQLLSVWLDVRRTKIQPLNKPNTTPSTPPNGARTPSPDTASPGSAPEPDTPSPPNKAAGGADYARCLSNLIWALVKLELVEKQDATAANLIMDITPLVLHYIPRYNSQGIANIIWSYAKLPTPPVPAVLKLLQHMTYMLGEPSEARGFDAQALSNSIWAAAHMSSRGVVSMDGDTSCDLAKFLVAVASNASYQLRALEFDRPRYQAHQYLKVTETKFSCQALVNIAWSFATLLSGTARRNASVSTLFQHIRTEAIFRLRTLRAIMESGDLSVARSSGSFNEQALSNLVFAYEKVELLDSDLLSAVFHVAMLRLVGLQSNIVLKPQEVCTLLRAARMEGAEPMGFINTLRRLLDQAPQVSSGWTDAEKQEVGMALTAAAAHQQLHQQRAEAAAAVAAEEAKRQEELQMQQHLQQEAQRRQQHQTTQQQRMNHQRMGAATAHVVGRQGPFDMGQQSMPMGVAPQTPTTAQMMQVPLNGMNSLAAQGMWQPRPTSPVAASEAFMTSLAMQQAPPTMIHMTDSLQTNGSFSPLTPQASLPQYSMMQQGTPHTPIPMRIAMAGLPPRGPPQVVKRPPGGSMAPITGQVLRASYAAQNAAMAGSPGRPSTTTTTWSPSPASPFQQVGAGQRILLQQSSSMDVSNAPGGVNVSFAPSAQVLDGSYSFGWQQ